jgi:uncharacterized protein YraI
LVFKGERLTCRANAALNVKKRRGGETMLLSKLTTARWAMTILNAFAACFFAAALWAVDPAFSQTAVSSRNVPLNVRPGEAPSVINGLVAGNTRLVHSVRVAAGQRLSVDLKSNNPDLVFGIYARSGAAVFEARRGQNSFSAVLRRSGTYAIIVSFTENARRKNALYRLSVGLSDLNYDPGFPQPPRPPVDQGEFVRVVGVSTNDTLAVRGGPGTEFEIIGELSAGTRRLRLGQCRQRGSGNWCTVSTTRSVPLSGWVNARFLSEDNS